MDLEYTNPEFVELFARLLQREIQDRVRQRDRPRLAEQGFQPGVLRHLNEPWHKQTEADRQLWRDAVKAVLIQVMDLSKTWTGIPPGPEQFEPRPEK